MSKDNKPKSKILLFILYFLEGMLVGVGALLPGVSGGALCVAFGMYRPVIETITNLKTGLKKHGLMLCVFILGAAAGFVGLSGVAAMLLEKNAELVTCAFIGLIIGTFPELWEDAGSQGRTKGSVAFVAVGFVVMVCALALLRTELDVQLAESFWSYLLCGALWGLSFIVPGLSSSTLILFFGLYDKMLDGIARLDFRVLLPMAVGLGACVLLLSNVVGLAYKKRYSLVSHCVLGIVAATAVMIFPDPSGASPLGIAAWFAAIVLGAVASYIFTRVCARLREKAE